MTTGTELNETSKKIRVGMSEAAATMTAIMSEISDTDICDELVEQFFKASTDLQNAISRRKYLLGELKMRREQLKIAVEDIRKQIDTMDRIAKNITDNTADIILSNPDVVFRDDLGRRVSVVKNSKTSVELTIPVKRQHYSNVVDRELADELFETGYVNAEMVYTVNVDRVRADLECGKSIPWALERRGLHLRGI